MKIDRNIMKCLKMLNVFLNDIGLHFSRFFFSKLLTQTLHLLYKNPPSKANYKENKQFQLFFYCLVHTVHINTQQTLFLLLVQAKSLCSHITSQVVKQIPAHSHTGRLCGVCPRQVFMIQPFFICLSPYFMKPRLLLYSTILAPQSPQLSAANSLMGSKMGKK